MAAPVSATPSIAGHQTAASTALPPLEIIFWSAHYGGGRVLSGPGAERFIIGLLWRPRCRRRPRLSRLRRRQQTDTIGPVRRCSAWSNNEAGQTHRYLRYGGSSWIQAASVQWADKRRQKELLFGVYRTWVMIQTVGY